MFSARINVAQRQAIKRAIAGVKDEIARYKHFYPGKRSLETMLPAMQITVGQRIRDLENELLMLEEGL